MSTRRFCAGSWTRLSRLGAPDLARSRQFDPSKGTSFTDEINDLTSKSKDDFISQLPVALQAEFSARAEDSINNARERAYTFQIGAMSDFGELPIIQVVSGARSCRRASSR